METQPTKTPQYGLQKVANPHQELTKTVDGKTFYRYPVKTPLVLVHDDFWKFIETWAVPNYKKGDIFCISTKVVSISKGYYVKESDLKVSWLAKKLVPYMKKWPSGDPGFAIPEKLQLAMNIAGMPRFLFAMVVGVILKFFGFSGWFYRLLGHNINAIDGFAPEMYPEPLRGYGFLPPKNPDAECDEIEEKYGMITAMLDGNNVENIVLGMSKGLKAMYSKKKFLEIIHGNPQGQEDGSPILILTNEPR